MLDSPVAVLSVSENAFVLRLLREFRRLQPTWNWLVPADKEADLSVIQESGVTTCVYIPALTGRDRVTPDLNVAKNVFDTLTFQKNVQFVLLSSALIYGTGPGRQGLACEGYLPPRSSRSRISAEWRSLEALALEYVPPPAILTILRAAIVLAQANFFSRQFSHRLTACLPGHDPSLQFLSLGDLAQSIICAIVAKRRGIFNVAPDSVIPLHQAVRLTGSTRLPIPRTLRRVIRRSDTLDFLRYSWTISNAKVKTDLGFIPRESSLAALLEFRKQQHDPSQREPKFDEFGMDEAYIRFYGKFGFRILSECYWRIESKGLEHIPRRGPGLLVGMHRGFMPWDGVMALHTIVTKTGRYPRFLTHPCLLKFPFLANFMAKLGGVVACQEIANHVLESNELVGIFPEGIQGTFTPYNQAYKLQPFRQDSFVKLAIRHRAPIIPFVTVGSAEIFPIFGKIKWRRGARYTGWPYIPVTATFPVLPLPLPSKWHTWFLPPIQVDQYPPEAAHDPVVVDALSREVRRQMQEAIDDMVSRRRSIFFGSIFDTTENDELRRASREQPKPG